MENLKFGYALGGMYSHYKENISIKNIKDIFPDCFYDDFMIDAVFGNFQFCIWDGGRIFPEYYHANLEQISQIRHYYNDILNVPIRFIYTNSKIEPQHLYDRFCNMVTELCENEQNEIVVNSPLLEEYLRNKYPKYKFISSTTKCILDQEKTKELLDNDDYSLICLDYNLNYNFNFLNSLTKEQKDKCEFLINAVCGAGCKMRKKHYELNSVHALTYGKPYNLNFCNIPGNPLYPYKEKCNRISYQDIKEKYAPLGFKHFKIEGRTFEPVYYINACVEYMVKPEYQIFIATNILLDYERNNK